MQREKKAEIITRIKKDGFKQVSGFSYLYINPKGRVKSLKTENYLKPTVNNYIKPEKEYLSLPKLILQAFEGQQYRAGKMIYIDGNKANLTPENLKYSRLFEPSRTSGVNKSDLMTAIRCYFEVDKHFKVANPLQTRLFMQMITEKRRFISECSNPQIMIYKSYLFDLTSSLTSTAKQHGLTVRDCAIIVNDFTNTLINDILNDLKNGILHLYDYRPKQPTETDNLRQWNEHAKNTGQKPVSIRKRSLKEKLKDFQKSLDEFKNTM